MAASSTMKCLSWILVITACFFFLECNGNEYGGNYEKQTGDNTDIMAMINTYYKRITKDFISKNETNTTLHPFNETQASRNYSTGGGPSASDNYSVNGVLNVTQNDSAPATSPYTTTYGSSRNPAKSCRDLASKGLLKNQPDVYFIETSDHELLQVFCPQTLTFIPSLNETNNSESYFNTSVNGSISNPENNTAIITVDGIASAIDGRDNQTSPYGVNVLVNQTALIESTTKEENAEGREQGDTGDYQGVANVTSQMQSRLQDRINNLEPPINNTNGSLDIYYTESKGEKETSEQPSQETKLSNSLLGRDIIETPGAGAQDKRSQVEEKIVKTHKYSNKNGSPWPAPINATIELNHEPKKMKIPLYKPVGALIKAYKAKQGKEDAPEKSDDTEDTSKPKGKPKKPLTQKQAKGIETKKSKKKLTKKRHHKEHATAKGD